MSSLLLETLQDGLNTNLSSKLESDPKLRQETEKYLQDILVCEQLLSTESFTTTSTSRAGPGDSQKTLTEEIADLDSQLRQAELRLASVTNQNRDLIVDISEDLKNVNTMIEADLEEKITSINSSLTSMKTTVDAKAVDKFSAAIDSSNSILSNLDSILDIYELPALCGLCIMQGNYQEALEIATMIKMLLIKFPNLKTFHHLQQQIDKAVDVMVKGLIRLLNTNLKQSNLFKIFQILNRPNLLYLEQSNQGQTFSSQEQKLANNQRLKLIFLNSRFKFITNEVNALQPLIKLKNVTYLKRYIEIYREHLFKSISVFYAIFGNSSEFGEDESDKHLLSSYISSLAHLLVLEIREHLPSIMEKEDEDNFESKNLTDGIILQIIYLCRSLSKHGLDFESLVTWELCFKEPVLISEEDWTRNLSKVKKFRS